MGILGGQRDTGYRWASAIDLIYLIKVVLTRASGTVMGVEFEAKQVFDVCLCVGVGVRVCVHENT